MRYGSYPYYGFYPGFEYLEPYCLMYLDFKGPEVFETNFTGYLYGHQGQIPVASSGGIIHRTGMNGTDGLRRKGIQLANGATNKVLNPVSGGAGNIAALGAATFLIGSMLKGFSWRTSTYVSTTAAANDGVSYTLSALANAIHFVTVALDVQISTQQWSLDGATWNVPIYLGPYNGWYMYGFQFPAAQANGSVLLRIRQSDATARVFHVGHAQVEQTNYPTATLHGAMGTGHAWTGAAHASTSTRTVSQLRYGLTNLTPSKGSFVVWWLNNTCSTTTQYGQPNRRIFEYYYDVNNQIVLFSNTVNTRMPTLYTISGGAAVDATSTLNTPQGWNYLVATWKVGNPLSIYLNGVLAGMSGANYVLPAGAATVFTIGDDQGGGNSVDGVLAGVGTFDKVLTANEVALTYRLGMPLGLYPRVALSECGDVHR